ncbi:aldehyde dehydrogenase family protein [Halomicrococcus sp. NG-SE-24]|uniref:aldehyde dehydrogenase family protein n=1 Tax=Halomicrococcus sp. NG-SE-24 TaxID=3436928 RepID=UPI003D986B85
MSDAAFTTDGEWNALYVDGEWVDAGMVHINDQPINDEPHVPFGGVKSSGMGRYNGDAILDELTQEKWISVQREKRQYPF